METRFLESFVTVVDLGSIAEAARHLRLTPAAVAQRIKALETELGHALLVRSGRNVRPTVSGMAILADARRLVHEIAGLSLLAAAELPFGELRIGATPSALTGVLPAALVALRRNYPGVEIAVRSGNSDELYSSVLSGTLDAGLIIRQSRAVPKSAGWRELRREPLIVLAPAEITETDAREVLRRYPLIRYDRNRWGGKIADAYLRAEKIAVREWTELDSLESIAVLVDRGLGVSLLPDWDPPWLSGLNLRKLALPPPVPFRSLGLLWEHTSPRIKLVHALVESLPHISEAD